MTGYSDRVDHAFAFAAKLHDQQVRRGTKLPYHTAAPMVALILARYGQDDDTVIAGVLYGVVADLVRDGHGAEVLRVRVGDKFGEPILHTLLGIVERRLDEDGVELSADERKDDVLERLTSVDERGRWVLAAAQLHEVGEMLSQLARTQFPDVVWARFTAGRGGTVRWHQRVVERLRAVGFDAPIVAELDAAVRKLSRADTAPSVR